MAESFLFREPIIRDREVVRESRLVERALIACAVLILSVFFFAPMIVVFYEAGRKGLNVYLTAIGDAESLSAIRLTLLVAAIAVPINTIFGIAAAWVVARFNFPLKSLLVTIIDLPFSVSPVVAGLSFVVLFGSRGYFAPFLASHGLEIIFALPGLALATTFVTFPFVARELIPLMQQQGVDDEEAALTLGASPFKMFVTVTLPNIKWGLLYGVLLCNARAMGEFGAVAVVSGRIRGETTTLPLHVEMLYGGFDLVGAFAVASILAGLALVTLIIKSLLEWRHASDLAAARRH
jgi:sulfate transport system permease protein